jgi:hypothetical protein
VKEKRRRRNIYEENDGGALLQWLHVRRASARGSTPTQRRSRRPGAEASSDTSVLRVVSLSGTLGHDLFDGERSCRSRISSREGALASADGLLVLERSGHAHGLVGAGVTGKGDGGDWGEGDGFTRIPGRVVS